MSGDVVVIGGGLSGLAAALRLGDAGYRPIVLESRRRLGGRASSFDDSVSGRVFDNCQHVLMGCCTNLLDFYTRIGVENAIEWHDTIAWCRPDGGRDVMRSRALPAPLHLAGSFRRMKLLDRPARRAVRRAMWRMLRIGTRGRHRFGGKTFQSLLDEWRQPVQAVRLFWEPIVVSACNVPLDEVAAVHALQVFQDGFLAGKWHATMGVPRVPLADLYAPASAAIADAGGEIRLGWKATGIGVSSRSVIGVETSRDFVRADRVVAALPWEQLDGILDANIREFDQRVGELAVLGHSPILGVHVLLDREVMGEPHLVMPGRKTHWFFNKGVADDGTQHIHAVVSAADAWMDRSSDEIEAAVLEDLAHAYPRVADAKVLQVRPIKERRATFRAAPQAEVARPHASPSPVGASGGDLNGLYLAGDWCATGWPATMEGAVRSGYLAAEAITGVEGVVADAPAGVLVRALAAG
ncbi:MAG: NAD(P)-binding protein [Planctomycetes bacterium]|nr:NAD(P)-binding protein [Planctomycetota bacterium]MCP4839070.1 NAD(P)-binding protein [Planctomycetota bacterium]